MKCWIAAFLLFLGSLPAFSQQEYYIYLQTDNNQAFYVRLNNKTISSSNGGYLILSQLPDTTLSFTIGFPKNQFPEQEFIIGVNKHDAGYMLANFGEKGWGLMSIQTLVVTMNANTSGQKKSPELNGTKSNSAFAVMLANTVNDSTVLYNSTQKSKIGITTPVIAIQEKTHDNGNQRVTDSMSQLSTGLDTKNSIVSDSGHATAIKPPVTAEKKLDSSSDLTKEAFKKHDSSLTANIKRSKDSASNNAALVTTVIDTADLSKKTAPKPEPLIIAKSKHGLTDSLKLNNNNFPKKDSSLTTISNPQNNISHKDSAVLVKHQPAIKEAEKKPIPETKPIVAPLQNQAEHPVNKDSSLVNTATRLPDSSIAKRTDFAQKVVNKKAVSKAAELSTDSNYVAIYIDNAEATSDTVRIQIPLAKAPSVNKVIQKPVTDFSFSDTIRTKKVDSGLAIGSVINPDPNNSIIPNNASDTSKAIKKSSIAIPNTDCKDLAWDSDIDRLRIKMLLLKTTEEKIALAKKLYTQKCFSTKQVKALSELFSTDEGKYQWCDAVYPFVSDTANFSSLTELFKEVYYLNRFKAMIRN
jgi:hypothetical protein